MKTESFTAEEQRLADAAAQAQAQLEASRARRAEITSQLEELVAARDNMATQIRDGEASLTNCNERMNELEAHIRANWNRKLAEAIEEHQRQEFLAIRLPRFLKDWKTELIAMDKQLSDFRAEHGLK